MRGAQYGGGPRETEMQAFERMLKTSPHFADVINTHRRATAAVSAQVLGALIAKGALEAGEVLGLLDEMSKAFYPKASDGTSRRLVASLVRSELADLTRKGAKRHD